MKQHYFLSIFVCTVFVNPPWQLELHFIPALKQEHLAVLHVPLLHPHPRCLPCPPTMDIDAAAFLSLITGKPVHSSGTLANQRFHHYLQLMSCNLDGRVLQ
jgi:hypothetical protein